MLKSVPFITQTQKSECGLCCVGMLCRYYKNFVSMDELRNRLEVGRDGSSFKQLVELLRDYNFKTINYKIPSTKLNLIKLPAIVFWGNNHFVVLESVKNKKYTVIDPAIGRIKLNLNEFENKYTGYAVSAIPNEKFKPVNKKTYSIKYIIPYIYENRKLYCKVIIMSIIVYCLTLSLPILIQHVIDSIISGNSMKTYNNFLAIIFLLSIMYCCTNYWKNVLLIKLRAYMDKSLNTNIFNHLVKLPYKFFSLRGSGDIIYTLNSSMNIRELFANRFISAIINIGMALVILVYIFFISKILGVISLLLFIINVLVMSITRPFLTDSSRSIVVNESNVQGIQMEAIYGMLGVKMSSIENDILQSWEIAYEKYYNKYIENEKITNYVDSANSFLQFFSPTVLLLVGIVLITRGNLSLGSIVAVYSLGTTFFGLSNSVIDLWSGFINSSIILDRLEDIINTEEEKDIEKNTIQLKGDIKLENVFFRYTKNSKPVIKKVSLDIKKGMKVAIVGKSGSGKSTLSKLLVGLFQPTEGRIFFDSRDFMVLNKKSVRKQIGIVPQDIMLFNKSIYCNIAMNRADIELKDVKKACELAHISEDIEAMPMNYYTEISELGLNLSGGQRQRIALARAIIGKPKILLLDEATSSLDNINEKKISEEIKKMGTTQIVIAHRLSTIIDADVIVVMEDGKIVEKGTHEQLINNKNGKYRELYTLMR